MCAVLQQDPKLGQIQMAPYNSENYTELNISISTLVFLFKLLK